MKNIFKGLAFVTAAIIIVPLLTNLAIKGAAFIKTDFSGEDAAEAVSYGPTETGYPFIDEVYIYDVATETVKTLDCEEFLAQAVLGTVSADSQIELLKAQTVLMYTYILGRRLEEEQSPTESLCGCDMSTDENIYIRLMSEDEAETLYGDSAQEYIDNVREAVCDVAGKYITYNGSPIAPAFCKSCGGVSESAETVLGIDAGYLKSVLSEYDEDYVTEIFYTSDELFARITTQPDGASLLGDEGSWIELSDVSDTGYVKSVLLGGEKKVSGRALVSWLNLPSARFTVYYSEEFDRFVFTVSGCGHLVGLSQYGANKMAEAGYDCEYILHYYFTDVEIISSQK